MIDVSALIVIRQSTKFEDSTFCTLNKVWIGQTKIIIYKYTR